MLEAKPEHLIGDKAYDSDKLDEQLREKGVEMVAPHRSNRKLKDPGRTQAAPLRAALDRRALLRLDAMEAATARALGVLPGQLPRLCAARGTIDPAEGVLR